MCQWVHWWLWWNLLCRMATLHPALWGLWNILNWHWFQFRVVNKNWAFFAWPHSWRDCYWGHLAKWLRPTCWRTAVPGPVHTNNLTHLQNFLKVFLYLTTTSYPSTYVLCHFSLETSKPWALPLFPSLSSLSRSGLPSQSSNLVCGLNSSRCLVALPLPVDSH